MKHLKYIKEYFDMEELSNKHSNSDIDFKKMVQNDSIIKSSLFDVIVAQIKQSVPYFKDWDGGEFEGNISLKKGYDWFIDKGESVLGILSIVIEVEKQDIIDKDRLEGLFYTVRYNSAILLLEGEERPKEEYTHLYEDAYEGVSNVGGGDVKVDFKNNFGMKKLLEFLKSELIPQIEKTVDEFENITREKIDRRGNTNPPIKEN